MTDEEREQTRKMKVTEKRRRGWKQKKDAISLFLNTQQSFFNDNIKKSSSRNMR